MRRLTQKRQEYEFITTRKRTWRKLITKEKAYYKHLNILKTFDEREILLAPEEFQLLDYKNRSNLLVFIDKIRRYVIIKKKRIFIDFRYTKRMAPCGTLLFTAEIDRLNRYYYSRRYIVCNYPNNVLVEQVLQHIGLLEILGRCPRRKISAENVRHWYYETGDFVKGDTIAPLIDRYEKNFTDKTGQNLYAGVIEAMTNSIHHAYESGRGDGIEMIDKRWWMFSQKRDGKLTVVFCDLGIGISHSLKNNAKNWSLEQVRRILSEIGLGNSDGAYISTGPENIRYNQ